MQKMNDLVSREAVIDAIRYRVCQGQGNKEHICNRGSCAYCGIMEIMNDISCIPRSSGWISTKDRLPEEQGQYVIIIDGVATTATYEPDFEETERWGDWREYFNLENMASIDSDWENIEAEVTYWQSLPEKGDNDE